MNILDKSFNEVNKAINCTVDGVPNDMHNSYNIIFRPITSDTLGTSPGVVEFDWDRFAAKFTADGDIDTPSDCIYTRFIKPSGAKADGSFDLYVAWRQVDGATENTAFYFNYRTEESGSPAINDWTIGGWIMSSTSNEIYPRPTGGDAIYQLTHLGSFPLNDKKLFSELVVKLTITSDYGEDIYVSGILMQINQDQLGSRQKFDK